MIRWALTAVEFRPDLSQPRLPTSLLGGYQNLVAKSHKLEEIADVLGKYEGRLHGDYLYPRTNLSNGDTQI